MVKSITNSLIKKLSRGILENNKKFRNIYEGEECYIYGNGVSLKWYDLKNFSDKRSIICGFTYLHKNSRDLNIVADIELHPFFFYPFWWNIYTKRYELNKINKFMKKSGRFSVDYPVFLSLSNYPAMCLKSNVYYIHNFGKKNPDVRYYDVAGTFSYMRGSLYGTIGLAMYMGFSKVYLVGMDYLHDEPRTGHFYEYGRGTHHTADIEKRRTEEDLFNEFKSKLEIDIILPHRTSCKFIKSIYYTDHCRKNELYRENNELFEAEDLQALSSLNMMYNIKRSHKE